MPCLCSGWWEVCQGGLGRVLTPKAPGWVFPGGNSATPEEQKEGEVAEGLSVKPCWKEVPVSPGILLKQNHKLVVIKLKGMRGRGHDSLFSSQI